MTTALAEACVDALLAHPILRVVLGPVIETQRTRMIQAVLEVLHDWQAPAGPRPETIPIGGEGAPCP